MQNDDNAKDLLAIHPQPMLPIRQKFFEYLSGWLGGPALYETKYGHPRLRARHLPYSI
jgi:hemoglobin